MKKFWLENRDKIITIMIGGVLFIGAVSIIAVISGTLMKVFGFEYKSVVGLILFFMAATVLSYPLNLVAGALPKALFSVGRIRHNQALILFLILDTVATSCGMIILDSLMISISATKVSIVIISFLLAVPGKEDFKAKE